MKYIKFSLLVVALLMILSLSFVDSKKANYVYKVYGNNYCTGVPYALDYNTESCINNEYTTGSSSVTTCSSNTMVYSIYLSKNCANLFMNFDMPKDACNSGSRVSCNVEIEEPNTSYLKFNKFSSSDCGSNFGESYFSVNKCIFQNGSEPISVLYRCNNNTFTETFYSDSACTTQIKPTKIYPINACIKYTDSKNENTTINAECHVGNVNSGSSTIYLSQVAILISMLISIIFTIFY